MRRCSGHEAGAVRRRVDDNASTLDAVAPVTRRSSPGRGVPGADPEHLRDVAVSRPPTGVPGADPEPGHLVRVWDRPTRVFHWVLVVLFIVCYVSGDRGRFDIHIIAGQALLILVVARIVWGFVGSDTARFRHFLRPAHEIVAHVRSLGERRPGHEVGHNPLGGLAVVLMLSLLVIHACSGLFAADVDGWNEGPLSHLVSYEAARNASAAHAITVDVLLVLVAFHIAAVAFYWLYRRDNLIGPMVTGRKHLPRHRMAPRLVADTRALAALAIAASLVFAVLWLAG